MKGPDDAEFVQVVHTDALERGILARSGHVDFYSNLLTFVSNTPNFIDDFKKKLNFSEWWHRTTWLWRLTKSKFVVNE